MTPATARGVTLVELVIGSGVLLAVMAVTLQLLSGGHRALRRLPEGMDVQQRVRVLADAIGADVRSAGAGFVAGPAAGPLALVPAVRPARRGLRGADAELAAFDDRVGVLFVPRGAPQAGLSLDMRSTGDHLWIDPSAPPCGPDGRCGFGAPMRALIVDISGVGRGYDVFTIGAVVGPRLERARATPALSKRYGAGEAWVAQAVQRTYYHQPSTGRVMRYDGFGSDVPLVDHIAALRVTYYADPDPRSVSPPPPGESSCVYAAGDPPVPLLEDLGGTLPRRLDLDQLRDGPVCGVAPNRFDGDLLRVRRIGIHVVGSVRPAARAARVFAVQIDVTPRNLPQRRPDGPGTTMAAP